MSKDRTVIDAVKIILHEKKRAMPVQAIYDEIIAKKLYTFKALDPKGIVNRAIRRHCIGLDFPSASPKKHFKVILLEDGITLYDVISHNEKIKTAIIPVIPSGDQLPEEKMKQAYQEHCQNIKQQLYELIMQNDPAFFENLVVKLLLKLGYGYNENAGQVVGGPHDGGIDGIIYQDRLGLDKIYVQAKRNEKTKTISSTKIRNFVGSMQEITKGVFITTSLFSKDAKTFVERQQQKQLKLIDGNLLVDLMLEYEVGVTTIKSFNTYSVDRDYFQDN